LVNSTFNPKFVSNFNLEIFSDAYNVSRFNMSGTVTKELTKVLILYSSKSKNNPNVDIFDREVTKGSIDFCKVATGSLLSLAFQNVFDSLKENSNLPLSCPLKPGFFFARNIKAVTVDELPKLLRIFDFDFEVVQTFKGMTASMKKFANLVTLTFRGRLNG
jgi:Protein of unknown function (DUF1091)